MKRLLLVAPVLAVAATAVLVSSGGAQSSGERTLKFVEKGGASRFVDNPPKARTRNGPPSPGDEFIFSSPLYDEGGARAGLVAIHCTIEVGPARNLADCQGTAKLKDGTLTVSGLSGESRTTIVAVTGGTGAYEGARGSVTSVSRSGADNAPSDDTIHLLG